LTRRLKLIVEGKGDVAAGASLVCKCAADYGFQVIIDEPPIRAGEAKKLRRVGELERYIELATGHAVDEIFILLDLDDGCAVEFAKEFYRRGEPIAVQANKKLRVCFCVREFEGWFLADIDDLRAALPDYSIELSAEYRNAQDIRGAKEELRRACKGKKYKPMRDQNVFVKKLNISNLAKRSRSFKKFLKEATGLSYDKLASGVRVLEKASGKTQGA
jgi:hypothetical protein